MVERSSVQTCPTLLPDPTIGWISGSCFGSLVTSGFAGVFAGVFAAALDFRNSSSFLRPASRAALLLDIGAVPYFLMTTSQWDDLPHLFSRRARSSLFSKHFQLFTVSTSSSILNKSCPAVLSGSPGATVYRPHQSTASNGLGPSLLPS